MVPVDVLVEAAGARAGVRAPCAVGLGGAALLGGCGSSGSSGGSGKSTPLSKRPPIGKEPGRLSILEWGGYEAGGTAAQTSGMWAGTPYTQQFGKHSVVYNYIVNDDQ